MKLRFLAMAAGLVMLGSAGAAPLTFSTFVAGGDITAAVGSHATIGFAYAGNKFVGSTYFNNQLYQTDLAGGSVQAFGAPIPIAPGSIGEIYVTSSLGLGGFGSRQVFAGSEAAGTVFRFDNDGSNQTSFVSGLAGDVRGIAFDPYGVYGNDMIVTTQTGNVYRVNSLGTASLLANVGGDAEGLDFAPQAFGPIASGALVVVSEGTGRLNAIAPDGTLTDLGLQFGTPEMLSFVPLNLGVSGNPLEGFYAASYPSDVITAGASQFATYRGEAVITDETSHQVFRIFWGGTSFLTEQIGVFPTSTGGGQPEDGVFVTAAILEPGCTVTNTCGEAPEPGGLALFGAAFAGLCWHRRRQGRR